MTGRACLLLMLAASCAAAQEEPPTSPGIPVVGRPTDHFYNAAGTGIKLTASVSPGEFPLNETFTLTLTATNVLNPSQIEKPSLKALEEFKPFQIIDESAALDPPAGKDQRQFVYKLRALSESTNTVPEIVFYYFDPKRIVSPNRPQDRFPKAVSNPVSIRVLPATKPPALPPTPLVVPAFAEGWTPPSPASQLLSRVSTALIILGPLAAMAWVVLWRRYYPDESRMRQIRKSRAARKALNSFRSCNSDQAKDVFLNYARERFALPIHQSTPKEVVAHLTAQGCDAVGVLLAEQFLSACDECRFSPATDSHLGLTEMGTQMIVTLELPA